MKRLERILDQSSAKSVAELKAKLSARSQAEPSAVSNGTRDPATGLVFTTTPSGGIFAGRALHNSSIGQSDPIASFSAGNNGIGVVEDRNSVRRAERGSRAEAESSALLLISRYEQIDSPLVPETSGRAIDFRYWLAGRFRDPVTIFEGLIPLEGVAIFWASHLTNRGGLCTVLLKANPDPSPYGFKRSFRIRAREVVQLAALPDDDWQKQADTLSFEIPSTGSNCFDNFFLIPDWFRPEVAPARLWNIRDGFAFKAQTTAEELYQQVTENAGGIFQLPVTRYKFSENPSATGQCRFQDSGTKKIKVVLPSEAFVAGITTGSGAIRVEAVSAFFR